MGSNVTQEFYVNIREEIINKRDVTFGSWSMKDDIVISGISGKYPESVNIEEFANNLYNHKDMVTDDDRRWPKEFFGAPIGIGKLLELEKFDSKFFNFDEKSANFLDSQLRMLLEITYEAIWDSGNDPQVFSGTRTGVFIGNCVFEYVKAYANIGAIPEFIQYMAQIVSHKYGFTGPSILVDTACASSFNALHEAITALRNDRCDQALVAGLNLSLSPDNQLNFFKLNMLSPEGKCKCLDASANGYAKGEACVAIMLQKKPLAKRIYATIIHSKTNNDGYEEMGITFPTWHTQRDIMNATYAEAGVNPHDVQYCESHSTGTQAGDPEEMRAICESMCSDNRKNPLLIGANKSNIGHTEGASGLCAISKVIISLENELIPANLHYNTPNPKIAGLMSGILKPIAENTPFTGDLVALNNFGFGGSNVHLIIKSPKIKATIDNNRIADKIPRLIQMCGRDENSVNYFFESLLKTPNKITRDLLSLINDISKTSPFGTNIGYGGMSARGFAIIENLDQNLNELKEFNANTNTDPHREVWFLLSGMGAQYSAMAKELIRIDIFEKSIRSSCEIMKRYSIDLLDLLLNEKQNICDSVLKSFVTIAAIQIALLDLLSVLNIKADGIIGHSNGEVICAYADGCTSAEETMVMAYLRGLVIENHPTTRGRMAALGMGAKEAKAIFPSKVYLGCDNSDDSVTVSGDHKAIEEFVADCKAKNIFATYVESSGIAFHCPLMYSIEEQLTQWLRRDIFPKDRKMSSRWISTNYNFKGNQINASYFVDNLLYPAYFNDALKQIPDNAIVIEISPHSLFKSMIKRSLGPNITYVPLMRKNENNLYVMLEAIGTLYTVGLNPSVEMLYPRVAYPVSNGTRILSPMVKWDHSKDYVVTKYPDFFNVLERSNLAFVVDLMDKEDSYIGGHRIDGKCLFPATGYLMFVWKQLADYHNLQPNQLAVEYQDVNLHRATMIPKTGETIFQSSFDIKTGDFQISEGGSVVVTGRILPLKQKQNLKYLNILNESSYDDRSEDTIVLKTKDIYKELRLRGYDYGQTFQCIREGYVENRKVKTRIEWRDNWVTFADCMLQMGIFGKSSKGLYIPVRIDTLRIDPLVLLAEVRGQGDNACLEAVFDADLNIGVAKGLEYRGAKVNLLQRNLNSQKPFIGSYNFEAYSNTNYVYNTQTDLLEYSRCCDRMASQMSKNIDISAKGLIQRHRPLDENLVKNALNLVESIESDKNKSLFQFLKDINELSEQKSIESLIDSNRLSNLATDLICDSYNTQSFLEPLMVTVFENRLGADLKILEINSSNALIYKELNKALDLYAYDCSLHYTLLHPTPQQLPDSVIANIDVKLLDQNISTIPSDIELIVYRDISVSLQPKDRQQFFDLKQLFESFYSKLKPNGFVLIICREELTLAEQFICKLLGLKQNTIADRRTEVIAEAEKFKFTFIGNYSDIFSVNALLFRKNTTDIPIAEQIFIEMTHKFDDWVPKLQTELKAINMRPDSQNIWLVAKSDPKNGILGFYNCVRREPNGNRIRIIFNANKTPNDSLLDINDSYLASIVKKDLKMNVINGTQLGYFKMTAIKATPEPVSTEHCFLNTTTRGDLTSLKWFECQHKLWPIDKKDNEILCHVCYSALNFRDIMLATGRLPADALPGDIALQDCILGLEFAGRDENGNRVMGMIPSKALATTCIVDDHQFLWPIPEHWSMEEAATVPCVYATAYYALIIRGHLKSGEKVLIHSGSGGVGQAAINICLSLDCHVFITVGSDAKRDFLKNLFPKLTDSNFSSSRDLHFKPHVMHETNGYGVDVVLNSLSEDKLITSLECLANNGRFLEIGKYDMSVNTGLFTSELMQNKTFHGILLDSLFNLDKNTSNVCINDRKRIYKLIKEGINAGVVKPLNRTIFSIDKCEEAFRFMASGRHMGKVVIKIRDEELHQRNSRFITKTLVPAIPRTVFNPNKSYIVTGGLGGMGLELMDWMLERGAKIFVITSRTGPTNAYQLKKLKYFTDCSTTVRITSEDSTTLSGAESLILTAQTLAPIGGIFHLQMILMDGLFENQTLDSFNSVCRPKSTALENLDEVSRRLCPRLDYFVAYSSGVSSRGTPGQSNYGFSNSVIDRVCDLRRADGLHALAIHWGVVGDVGYVTENISADEELEMFGTVPQRMPSCLATLDRAIQSEHPICVSFVRSEIRREGVEGGKCDLMKRVAHILGVDDYSKLDPNIKLIKLGMDSLMAVEVKQAIERDFDIVLSTQEIREFTIAMIQNINSGNKSSDVKESAVSHTKQQLTESMFAIPKEEWIALNSAPKGKPIFFMPPHNGSFDSVANIAAKFQRPVYGLNWTTNCLTFDSMQSLATYYLNLINRNFPKIDMNFDLIGYSFGGIVAFEMSLQLQNKWSRSPRLLLLDSSPIQFKSDLQFINETILNQENSRVFNEELIDIHFMVGFLLDKTIVEYEAIAQVLKSIPNKVDRFAKVADILIEKTGLKCDRRDFEFSVESYIRKVYLMRNNSIIGSNDKRFDGDLVLLRAEQHWISGANEQTFVEKDYGLSQLITGNCDVLVFNGEHETFLDLNLDIIIDKINIYFQQ